MPIYDYRCDHCGHAFSALQSFKDEALAACPSCGMRPRRLLTSAAIVFKGPGWYKTDSRVAPKESADGAKPAEKAPEKPAPAKTEKAAPDKPARGTPAAKKEGSS